MDVSAKPVVVISKCLGFDTCRYDGVTIHSDEVDQLKPLLNFIPVCPEMEIGLGVPHDPIRIIYQDEKRSLLQTDTGLDCTDSMNIFLDSFFMELKIVDGFILKEKSPSCGIRRTKIYPGPGKIPLIDRAAGFFGAAALERFPHLPIETEDRLTDPRTRKHFLARLFAVFHARLRHS